MHTVLLDIDECGPLVFERVEELINQPLIAEIAGIFKDVDIRIDQSFLSRRKPGQKLQRTAECVDVDSLISGPVSKLPEGRLVQSLAPAVWQIGLPHSKAEYRPRNR